MLFFRRALPCFAALALGAALAPAAPVTPATAATPKVPRDYVVTSLGDGPTDGVCDDAETGDGCTLREALTAANAAPDENRILIDEQGIINLTKALPDITQNVKIEGPGADKLTVRRDSGGDYRVFYATNIKNRLAIAGLTISNGRIEDHGAGIHCRAELTLTNCVLSGNYSTKELGYGGGVALFFAGATIRGCTFSDNSAGVMGGGLFWDDSGDHTVTVENCTFSGNQLINTHYGGAGIGIVTFPPSSTLEVSHCTFADNRTNGAIMGGGGILVWAEKNGVATLMVGDTLFSRNTGGNLRKYKNPEATAKIVSRGHNLSDDNTGADEESDTDLFNLPALLGPLQDNGGGMPTHALLPGSPAIDAGNPKTNVAFDQRGIARPQNARPDIGAYEAEAKTNAPAK